MTPTWPLGAHSEPMRPEAELTMESVAALVAEFVVALDLDDVIVLGVDTGGAIAQLVAVEHPERLGGLVLTSCDALRLLLVDELSTVSLGGRPASGRVGFYRRIIMTRESCARMIGGAPPEESQQAQHLPQATPRGSDTRPWGWPPCRDVSPATLAREPAQVDRRCVSSDSGLNR